MRSTYTGIDKKILEEAAEHYLSLQDDSMSGAELKAWQAWFMRSKDHQMAFRRLETLWGVLEHVSADDIDLEAAGADEAVDHKTTGASVIGLIAPNSAATAARRPNVAVRVFGGLAASVAAAFVAGYLVLTPAGGELSEVPVTAYHTVAGEQRAVNLADGSIVELGPESAVEVRYSAAERGLELTRGQAVFTVAKNPNRPFVVRAGNGTVTAIGTVFNVRRSSGDVQVRVLEGTVAVRPQPEDLAVEGEQDYSKSVALVTAGNQTLYSGDGLMTPIEKADLSEGLAWRVGVLTMVNRELSDVIQELNRFVENEIAIGDDAIGKFHFTGTVYPDKLDEWLEGLTQGYPLKVVEVGSRTILMLDDSETTH
jgi:transmembrane sensor